jgi:hypothetical protein
MPRADFPARTSEMLRSLPYPVKRRSPWPYLFGGAGLLAAVLAAAWFFGPRRSALFPTRMLRAHPASPATPSGQPAAAVADRNLNGHPGQILEPLDAPRTASRARPAHAPQARTDNGKSPKISAPPEVAHGNGDVPAAAPPDAESERASAAQLESAVAAAAAATAAKAVERGGEHAQEEFVQAQTLVREEDPSAYERIGALLAKRPSSPDLRLLKCQVLLKSDPASAEARRELAALLALRPEFLHPVLYHERVLYLLWQTDAAAFEAQKTTANRVNLLKSANAYLAEYESQPAYRAKVQEIKNRLPQ